MTDKKPSDNNLRFTRRGLFLGAAAGSVGAFAASRPAHARTPLAPPPNIIDLSRRHPFYGTGPQAGIHTRMQHYVVYMTFDLATSSRRDLRAMLALWSAAIARMTEGKPIGMVEPDRPSAIGRDTGEALNLGPSSLTVTVGFGPGVFTETYGLAHKKPALLRELKRLPGDALKPEFTGGDLSLQACADDPQVAYHAIRDLARISKQTGAATTRWTVQGFNRDAAGKKEVTPRNLLGFRDGTRNIRKDEDYERFVWVKDGPAWQHRGSYQVVRKVRMNIESWDTDPVSDQMRRFGRYKVSGAPLTGEHEFDTPDFDARDSEGNLIIAPTAHIRLAAHENNNGLKILRRSFNYTDGIDQFGMLDAGLLFICYQNDPAHFETLQAKLGASGALNEYISHVGSAVFFVPPASEKGSYIGESLFT